MLFRIKEFIICARCAHTAITHVVAAESLHDARKAFERETQTVAHSGLYIQTQAAAERAGPVFQHIEKREPLEITAWQFEEWLRENVGTLYMRLADVQGAS